MQGIIDLEKTNQIIQGFNLPSNEVFRLNTLKQTKKLIVSMAEKIKTLERQNTALTLQSESIEYPKRYNKGKTKRSSPFSNQGFKSIERFNLETDKRIEVYMNLTDCKNKTMIHNDTVKRAIMKGSYKGEGWRLVPNEKPCVLCNKMKIESKNFHIKDKKLNYYYNHCIDCDNVMRDNRKAKAKAKREV